MQSSSELLKNNKLFDLYNKESNLTPEEERRTKDIGGILVPNAFQVPNEIVDEGHLALLSGTEVKVLLYIIRKTFGYNKVTGDKIPLSQFINGTVKKDGTRIDWGTGLSRRACIDALKTLEKVQLIRIVRAVSDDGTKKINYYQLITRLDYNKSNAKSA